MSLVGRRLGRTHTGQAFWRHCEVVQGRQLGRVAAGGMLCCRPHGVKPRGPLSCSAIGLSVHRLALRGRCSCSYSRNLPHRSLAHVSATCVSFTLRLVPLEGCSRLRSGICSTKAGGACQVCWGRVVARCGVTDTNWMLTLDMATRRVAKEHVVSDHDVFARHRSEGLVNEM